MIYEILLGCYVGTYVTVLWFIDTKIEKLINVIKNKDQND